MVKTIAAVIVLVIGGFLAYVATRPDTFRVERSATIKASAHKVHALIEDFERWSVWSPWEKQDPAMKRSVSPTTRGKGARYECMDAMLGKDFEAGLANLKSAAEK